MESAAEYFVHISFRKLRVKFAFPRSEKKSEERALLLILYKTSLRLSRANSDPSGKNKSSLSVYRYDPEGNFISQPGRCSQCWLKPSAHSPGRTDTANARGAKYPQIVLLCSRPSPSPALEEEEAAAGPAPAPCSSAGSGPRSPRTPGRTAGGSTRGLPHRACSPTAGERTHKTRQNVKIREK